MIKPLISIILPNYNHAKFLQERLDSIFNQTYKNFEVLILDDASTDNSIDVLKLYRSHPKVSHFIVNEKNTGSPFKQWQKGLNLAKGDFIWIAESDDFCDLNFLESQLEQMKSLDFDIVVAETKIFKNQSIVGTVQHPIFRESNTMKLSLDSFLYCPILNVSAVLFKSSTTNFVSQFHNYKLIGDRVFYFDMFLNKKIALNSHTTSYFRKEDHNTSELSNKDLDYFILYYQEHFRFAYDAYKSKKINKKLYQSYIQRFFNRVNNRLIKPEKLHLKYLKLRLQYYLDLKR